MNAKNQTKHTTEPGNIWRSSRASVSGRYNTPPVREDLIPRSRMAPEGKTEEKREEVKLSCFFDKRVKPMNLERLKNLKEEYNKMNKVENTPLEKRNEEHY